MSTPGRHQPDGGDHRGRTRSGAGGAFQGIAKAGELIDMSVHKGEHPRMGATDVCPFCPIAGSHGGVRPAIPPAGDRVAEELKIPVYLYEARPRPRAQIAGLDPGRGVRGLPKKLQDPNYKPDFGRVFNARSGATSWGRAFLIAYKLNLNTRDKKLANAIAFALRERGTASRAPTGRSQGRAGKHGLRTGALQGVAAVGWVIEEYGCARSPSTLSI